MTAQLRPEHDSGATPDIRSVLVGVDGSEHAAKAIDLAADMAGKYGAKLTIVTVMEEEGSDRTSPELAEFAAIEGVTTTEREILESRANRLLSDMVGRARERGAESPTSMLLVGEPHRMILLIARRIHADMIVLGSRGLGGVRSLLGSVSQRVAHNAECTVITVK